MFDYWINNGDRTLTELGGNPNLYFNLVSSSLVVFDHNLAFDQDFSLKDHKRYHVASFLFRGQADMDEEGNKTGESRTKEGVFGDKYVEHTSFNTEDQDSGNWNKLGKIGAVVGLLLGLYGAFDAS